MDHAQGPDEMFGTDGPAQLPASDAECFTSTSDGDSPVPHPGQSRCNTSLRDQTYNQGIDIIGYHGLMSHSTHYRSFWRQFYKSDDPTNSVTALKNNG